MGPDPATRDGRVFWLIFADPSDAAGVDGTVGAATTAVLVCVHRVPVPWDAVIPFIVLLFGLHSGAPLRTAIPSSSASSVSAVDVSEAQRFGWVHAAARLDVVSPSQLERAAYFAPQGGVTALSPAFSAESALAELKGAREVALAARWIDALPLKVDARNGGLLFAFRLRGP